MAKNNQTERRERTVSLVNNMLDERRQLLSLMLQLSDVTSGEASNSDFETLDEFCQVLVDYIAAGHFGLFERISEGKERRRSVADLAMRVYSKIERSTEIAMQFNEKYDPDNEKMDLSHIHEDLSRLGEELTARIEAEDQLIGELLDRSSVVPAA